MELIGAGNAIEFTCDDDRVALAEFSLADVCTVGDQHARFLGSKKSFPGGRTVKAMRKLIGFHPAHRG